MVTIISLEVKKGKGWKSIPVLGITKDCNKTKKNIVFDSSETLPHSTSQGTYSSGFFENVSANQLIFSILIDDMRPRSNFCIDFKIKGYTYFDVAQLQV